MNLELRKNQLSVHELGHQPVIDIIDAVFLCGLRLICTLKNAWFIESVHLGPREAELMITFGPSDHQTWATLEVAGNSDVF